MHVPKTKHIVVDGITIHVVFKGFAAPKEDRVIRCLQPNIFEVARNQCHDILKLLSKKSYIDIYGTHSCETFSFVETFPELIEIEDELFLLLLTKN